MGIKKVSRPTGGKYFADKQCPKKINNKYYHKNILEDGVK